MWIVVYVVVVFGPTGGWEDLYGKSRIILLLCEVNVMRRWIEEYGKRGKEVKESEPKPDV